MSATGLSVPAKGELDLLSLAVDDGLDVVEQPLGDLVCSTQLVSSHGQPPDWKPIGY